MAATVSMPAVIMRSSSCLPRHEDGLVDLHVRSPALACCSSSVHTFATSVNSCDSWMVCRMKKRHAVGMIARVKTMADQDGVSSCLIGHASVCVAHTSSGDIHGNKRNNNRVSQARETRVNSLTSKLFSLASLSSPCGYGFPSSLQPGFARTSVRSGYPHMSEHSSSDDCYEEEEKNENKNDGRMRNEREEYNRRMRDGGVLENIWKEQEPGYGMNGVEGRLKKGSQSVVKAASSSGYDRKVMINGGEWKLSERSNAFIPFERNGPHTDRDVFQNRSRQQQLAGRGDLEGIPNRMGAGNAARLQYKGPHASSQMSERSSGTARVAAPLVASIPYSVMGDPHRRRPTVLRKEPTGWLPGDPDIRGSGLDGSAASTSRTTSAVGIDSKAGHGLQREDTTGTLFLDTIVDRIRASGIIACVKAETSDVALQAARAALDASVSVLEITLTTPAADDVIRTLVAEYPHALIGAGTVLGMLDAASVIKAGAKFLMSPGTDEHLIGWLKEGPALLIPGAMTPTELMHASRCGARAVKVFPVTAVGGVHFVEAMRRPFSQVPLIPAHGITLDMVEPYITAGAIAVVLSDAIFDRAAMAAEDFGEIAKRAAAAAAEGRRAVQLRDSSSSRKPC